MFVAIGLNWCAIEALSEVRQWILDYFAKNGYVIVGKYLPADEHNLYFTPLNR